MLRTSRAMLFWWAVVLGCGFTIGYAAKPQTAKASPPLKGFTIHQTETSYPKEENAPPVVMESSLSRRSDGSWVHTFDVISPQGESNRVVEFFDARARVSVQGQPFTKSRMTFHLGESEIPEHIRAAFKVCDGDEKDESLPRSNILGYEVVRIVRDVGFGIDTSWVAPALDCYPLEDDFLFRSGSHSETKVTSIQEGEPPDSAFQLPPDFVERSPEERRKALQ